MKPKIFISFLIYGCLAAFLSFWWQRISDAIFIFNIPGVLIGDEVYRLAINYLGNPNSPQAHYTIPWLLRITQVYIPVSIIFWGTVGLIIQFIVRKISKPSCDRLEDRPR